MQLKVTDDKDEHHEWQDADEQPPPGEYLEDEAGKGRPDCRGRGNDEAGES